MSAATEQQNNGDVAVEKIAADAVKDDLKSQKADVEESKPVAADNGTASKDEVHEDVPVKEHVKGTKRPSEAKISESKKAKKEKVVHDSDDDGDEEEIIDEESDEYDIPYDGDDDEIECEDDDDDNDDGSGSDDQA